MKNLLILLFFSLISAVSFANSVQIRLQGYPVQEGKTNHSHLSRAPIAPLYIEQEGHILNILHGGNLVKVTLLQKGCLVYEMEIQNTSIVEFPSYVQGDFEVQLTVGGIEYVGDIHF